MMKSNLYVACATDRETLEFLKLLDQLGYRFPNGERLPVENMPRRDSRLPWALDTAEKTAAFTNPATVGYLCRLRDLEPVPFARLDRQAL